MDLERSILKVIRGEKKAPLALAALSGLSALYRSVLALRNLGYDWGVLPSHKLSVPVISVGNIVVGGTGKTPLVRLLAETLQDKVRLAILTRGYKSQIEKAKLVKKISSGMGPLFGPVECGDEPYFLAQKTKACIWVGPNRVSSGQQAISQGANCLLLDDGMQHRQLKRDFDIVILDANAPFSNGRFLPRGLLRDSPGRLKGASLIVATHVKDLAHFNQVQSLISAFTSAPIIGAQVAPLHKTHFRPRKAGLFCGIGQPDRFLQTARDLKSEIVDTLILKDHETPHKDQLEKFAQRCLEKGAEALLCTEKDYVKLPPDLSLKLDIVPVEIELKIIAGKEHWDHLTQNILDKVVT
jgi:tetraacyldisaccharide 4'-kinase